ncbi:MAG: carboxylesterase family protein [Bacteroidales bacterium]|jgi:para-nitrobenzyl esterase|nr:carboxylesterase family protein [Bacteroidales bacterium]
MKTDRRKFIRTVGAGTAGLTLAAASLPITSCTSSVGKKKEEEDGQVIFIGDNIAIAETTNGKVRGFIHKDIYNFLGIPYGASTEGKNRFMPPQKPEPWTDIYPAVYWPNAAPQILDNFYANRYLAFTDYWHYDDVSENCLGINVWTPGYSDGTKRPVILWIHGGGFTSGNSIEHPEYHGENLSRKENVVFCSLNHRLGPLGFSDFGGIGGEKYAASGNVGMLDIVAALEWIRDNISNFGGDPGNVTIIGQSGGGAKVCTLTAMPSAKGLFHRAVALSGASLRSGEKNNSEKLAAYILKEAGLNASQLDKLQEMPWRDYYALTRMASAKMREESGTTGMMGGFSPVVDGRFLPQHPFSPAASDLASDIPMIVCTTFYERSPSSFDSSLEDITLDKAKELVKTMRGFGPGLGENSPAIIDAYALSFPDRKPIEILAMVLSNRKNAIELCNVKSLQSAPVYLAWFGWNPPLFDGRLRAFHTMDISFWFYNTDVQISHTGGGSRPRKLATAMSGSLAQFMRTGNPNGGGLPEWPEYTSEKGETMILDDVSEVQNDPDREARKSLP